MPTKNNMISIRVTEDDRKKLEGARKNGESVSDVARRHILQSPTMMVNNPETRGFDPETGLHKDTSTPFDLNGFAADMRHETGSLFHPDTGLDWQGFDAFGYDVYGYDNKGIHRDTGLDWQGFDADGKHKTTRTEYDPSGVDRDGYDKRGFHVDTKQSRDGSYYDNDGVDYHGLDRSGNTLQGFARDGDGRWKHRSTEAIHDDDLYDHCGYLVDAPYCDRTVLHP